MFSFNNYLKHVIIVYFLFSFIYTKNILCLAWNSDYIQVYESLTKYSNFLMKCLTKLVVFTCHIIEKIIVDKIQWKILSCHSIRERAIVNNV
jgi:hypothetical protein